MEKWWRRTSKRLVVKANKDAFSSTNTRGAAPRRKPLSFRAPSDLPSASLRNPTQTLSWATQDATAAASAGAICGYAIRIRVTAHVREGRAARREHARAFAEHQVKRERRRRKEGRPVQRRCERPREVNVADRFGRGGVERAFGSIDGEKIDPDDVVDMDPRAPLPAVSDDAAETGLKNGKESRERATVAAEHDPGSNPRNAHPELGGARRLVPHSTQTWARKSSPGGRDSVNVAVSLAP